MIQQKDKFLKIKKAFYKETEEEFLNKVAAEKEKHLCSNFEDFMKDFALEG